VEASRKARIGRAVLGVSVLLCAGGAGVACSAIAGLDKYWEDPCFDAASCPDGAAGGDDVTVVVGDDQSSGDAGVGDAPSDRGDVTVWDGNSADSSASEVTVADVSGEETPTQDGTIDAQLDGSTSCLAGELACDAACVVNDVHNCGACGNDCTQLPGVLASGLSCNAGKCSYMCAAGYSDCEPGKGCALLSSDDANCGTCGHGCQGGACLSGACQPVAVASGQYGPFAVAVNATDVYWLDGHGNVLKCPLTGCPPAADGGSVATLVASGPIPLIAGAIALDQANVYWISGNAGLVMKCPLSGCTSPTVLASGQTPYDIALDDTYVYWANDSANGGVMRCPLSGCNSADGGGGPVTFASSLNCKSVDVSITGVYWASNSDVLGCALSGCPTASDGGSHPSSYYGSGIDPLWVRVNSTYVFWIDTGTALDQGSINWCFLSGCLGAPDGGSQVGQFATGQNQPVALVADSKNLYWVNSGLARSDGAIMMWPLSGAIGVSSPILMASGQFAPNAIALDSTSVYWTNSDAIMKVAR
jgi:hypothetical protein